MNIREIVREYLKANGYDGLCDVGAECGCRLGDFMPCDDATVYCEAGHLAPGDDLDERWVIVPGKKEKADAEK